MWIATDLLRVLHKEYTLTQSSVPRPDPLFEAPSPNASDPPCARTASGFRAGAGEMASYAAMDRGERSAAPKAHLNLSRSIKGPPLKAFAGKTVFSPSIAAGFPSPSAIWIPPPAAMEQLDVLRLRSRIPDCPSPTRHARAGGRRRVCRRARSRFAASAARGLDVDRAGGRRAPGKGSAADIRRHRDIISPDEPDARQGGRSGPDRPRRDAP